MSTAPMSTGKMATLARYLEEFPDYLAQGESLTELIDYCRP